MNYNYSCRCYLEPKETLINFIKSNQRKSENMAQFRTGAAPDSKSNGQFFTCADNVIHEVILLADGDELVSVDQYGLWQNKPPVVWASCGSNDPGKDLGIKSQFREFIPCLIKNDGKWELRLWSMPKKPFKNIYDQFEMGAELKGFSLKVRRTGTGLGTDYAITPQKKSYSAAEIATLLDGQKIPTPNEIGALLGPDEREDIIKMIEERTGMKYSDLLDSNKKSAVELEDL